MKKIILAISILYIVFLVYSCSPSTVITKIYLQDAAVNGPINQSPVHVTSNNETGVTISPRISINNKKSLRGKVDNHTLVNSQGVFQVDTIFNNDGTFYFQETPGVNRYSYTEKNFLWNIAEVNASLDFDFKISKSFALFAGGNYSVVKQKSIWGGLFGLGLMNQGFRFDIGLSIQEIPYEASTVITVTETGTSGTSSYVAQYLDASTETCFNPFVNLNVNSNNPEWLVNIFLQAGYAAQTLLNFEPKTSAYHNPFYYENVNITEDLRGEATAGIINLTPGVYFNFGDTGRVLLGTRLLWITQIEDIDNQFYLLPMLQFDFRL